MNPRRMQELEDEVKRCEECADKFASGQMVFYTNGLPMPGDEMSNRYRGYADSFRELIKMYREHNL